MDAIDCDDMMDSLRVECIVGGCPILLNYGAFHCSHSRRLWQRSLFSSQRQQCKLLAMLTFLIPPLNNLNLTVRETDTLAVLNDSPSITNCKAERESISTLLEFRHLRYLIAVAEEENISRAAKRLFVAQPSLSIQLKSMEDALSIELLVRVPKGVKLTPAAEVLTAGARQILALCDEVIAAARASHNGTIAPLRIGYTRNR